MQNPDDHRIRIEAELRRRLFDKGHRLGLLACAAWPVALALFAPGIFDNLLIGAALVVASIAQFLWLPDLFGKWMAHKKD